MQSYIETLGRLIASQVAPHPRRARRMLTAAYSWVRFSGKRKKLTDAKSAYARMNGRVADTLIRGMNQPQQAVMVNIFMPCELLLLPQDDDRHGGIRRAAQTAADCRNDAGL